MSDVIDTDLGWKRISHLGDIYTEAGTDIHYAKYLERGTEKMEPHPFLGPTLERHGNYESELYEIAGIAMSGKRLRPMMERLGQQVALDLQDEIMDRHLIKSGDLFRSQSFSVETVGGEA